MKGQVKVTYQELRNTGNELKANADKYSASMGEAMRLVMGLTGSEAWTGAAQKIYEKQMKKLQKGIDDMTRHISEYQKKLDNAAQQYDTAEQKNVSNASGLQTDLFS